MDNIEIVVYNYDKQQEVHAETVIPYNWIAAKSESQWRSTGKAVTVLTFGWTPAKCQWEDRVQAVTGLPLTKY